MRQMAKPPSNKAAIDAPLMHLILRRCGADAFVVQEDEP